MPNPTYFEEKKETLNSYHHAIITHEGFGGQFSLPVNDNKLPKAILIKRYIIGGILFSLMGLFFYLLT
jgi:hypothetical protein